MCDEPFLEKRAVFLFSCLSSHYQCQRIWLTTVKLILLLDVLMEIVCGKKSERFDTFLVLRTSLCKPYYVNV